MITNYNIVRVTITLLLVILFPLVQNQWLNLYLFNVNSFSIYKFLYYLSGLIFPFLICKISLNEFTFYKFEDIKKLDRSISGKVLLLIVSIILFFLSNLISNYLFFNINIFLKLLSISNNIILDFFDYKNIMLLIIISIFLLIKKSKILIKKLLLINYFTISIFLWYAKLNNILLSDFLVINNILKIENLNYLNTIFWVLIETTFFSWSYVSYKSNLSDWMVPIPRKKDISPFFNLIFFYLIITIYYSILDN